MASKNKNLLKPEILTICDYATISQEGKLSILGIFDQIYVTQFPAQHLRMFVVSSLTGLAGSSHTITLRLIDPLKEEKIKQEMKVVIGPNGKASLLAELGNLPLPVAGEYTIEIKEATVIGSVKFSVFKTSQGGVNPSPSNKENLN